MLSSLAFLPRCSSRFIHEEVCKLSHSIERNTPKLYNQLSGDHWNCYIHAQKFALLVQSDEMRILSMILLNNFYWFDLICFLITNLYRVTHTSTGYNWLSFVLHLDLFLRLQTNIHGESANKLVQTAKHGNSGMESDLITTVCHFLMFYFSALIKRWDFSWWILKYTHISLKRNN